MHTADKWRQKKGVKKETITFDGDVINIRSLTYEEKQTLCKFESNIKAGFYVWDKCVNDEDNPKWTFLEPEFEEIFKENDAEFSAIINYIIDFSGASDEAAKKLGKL